MNNQNSKSKKQLKREPKESPKKEVLATEEEIPKGIPDVDFKKMMGCGG